MCGIFGVVTNPSSQQSVPQEHFHQALATLRHRGPDADGQYQDRNVWLAHTRLSILDLTSAGNQPMKSEDGHFVISYNGEVYNFHTLAMEYGLENLRSGSDTEVVLRLFSKIGVDALIKLNGMFAFAVYDAHKRRLWLVRDRLGIKPLYYQLDDNRLVFASEIKAILALNPQPLSCDISALHEWLYYGNPLGERTLYNGIRQLLPGHFLEIDLTNFGYAVHEYWSLKQQAKGSTASDGGELNAIEETKRLLEQAVKRQLVSDVPVGVFLSGGVDSSAIAAFASRHYERRLATYSAGFDFAKDGGELPRARRVAALYGTDHHEIHITGGSVGDLIEKMVHHHDMPFSDAANIPLYLMASRISGDSKVVLQGDGGDELFGGYRRYATLKYYRPLRSMALGLRHLHRLTPKSALHYRVHRYLEAFAAADRATTMALLLTVEGPGSAPNAIFTEPLRYMLRNSDPFARFRECQSMFGDHDIGNQMSLVDLMIVLPDTYLEKVDRSTMAASLEVRVPFLDYDLVDFVVQLPGHEKMPWGRKKWLLKKALHGIVPDEILYGPKTGLTVPYGKWLQGALKPMFFDHLSQFAQRNPGVLEVDHISRMYARTGSGQRNHSHMLWKVLNFMIWANNSNIRILDAVAN
jgi:asparagine synthase (glutamine-hydrolysing)